MFFFTTSLYTEDCKHEIDRDKVNEFYNNSSMCVNDFSDEFGEFALLVMRELGLSKPTNVKEAFDLYIKLLQRIETIS